jgi:type IV pilus assembly protein PilN
MIRINLLPREEKARRKSSASMSINPGDMALPAMVLGIAILVVAVMVFHQSGRASSLQKSIALVEAQSRELAPQIERVNQLARERAELDLRLGIIAKLQQGRTQSVALMDELAKCVPDHLWLTSATQDGSGLLNLDGMTFSNLVVSDFMSRLERSPSFGDVQLGVAERGQIEGKDVVRFHLTCQVHSEPEAN